MTSVVESLNQLLDTPAGKRVRLPAFGSEVSKLLFDVDDADTYVFIRTQIVDLLNKMFFNGSV